MDGNLGDQNEFDESGGSIMPPPSDVDPESNQKEAMEVREAWEVRELMRVWRDLKDFVTVRTEEMERERRRKMTDEERYREDVEEGVYRRPGEQRRNGDGAAHSYHHRGAFYMDEDTLEKAGKDDIRHKAAEYARAATGEDTFNRKAMPKVLQVKKFGYAGYSTKYKGLAKEDTTDKSAIFMSKRKDQRNHESNKSSSRRR
jgi:microfibrillar-associated protein 1